MNWFVYALNPIDTEWDNLKTYTQAQNYICKKYKKHKNTNNFFKESWKSAQKAALDKGWDGSFRHEPYVFWIPNKNNSFNNGFIIKQDENGTTFVISPNELPYLND